MPPAPPRAHLRFRPPPFSLISPSVSLPGRIRRDGRWRTAAASFEIGELTGKYETNIPLAPEDPTGLYVFNIVFSPTNTDLYAGYSVISSCAVQNLEGQQVTYFRNPANTEWGRNVQTRDGKRIVTKWGTGGTIPSGTGFWYKRTAGSALRIEFGGDATSP